MVTYLRKAPLPFPLTDLLLYVSVDGFLLLLLVYLIFVVKYLLSEYYPAFGQIRWNAKI